MRLCSSLHPPIQQTFKKDIQVSLLCHFQKQLKKSTEQIEIASTPDVEAFHCHNCVRDTSIVSLAHNLTQVGRVL